MTTAKAIRIEVTAEDIERGLPLSQCWCPVARAIKRTLYGKPGDTMIRDAPVRVGTCMAQIGDGHATLSWAVVEFIEAFDAGKPVQPFSFDLT